jgi:hypothetical protein
MRTTASNAQSKREKIIVIASKNSSWNTPALSGESDELGNGNPKAISFLFEGALVEAQNFRVMWLVHTASKKVAELITD